MRQTFRTIACRSVAILLLLSAAQIARAQGTNPPYPSMAPLEQYLMNRADEISLARSAAAPAISADADVMVLGAHGYETAIHGKNGFVCMVQRSWAAGFEDPEFWNPKLRSPICLNPPGARSYLPLILKKADLALAGRSLPQIVDAVDAAVRAKAWPDIEAGAIGYMLSRQAYLSDHAGHWHPHLMFFVPLTDPQAWGVGLAGSPIYGAKDTAARVTVFFIPVRNWSDGEADLEGSDHKSE